MLGDQRRIGQRPEVLSRLQLRGVRRQEEQMHMLRHATFDTGVPPGAVKHQHNLLVWTSANLTRELGQFDLEDRDADGGGQMKDRPPGGRMDEADEVPPRKTVLDDGGRTLANRRPDPPQERF